MFGVLPTLLAKSLNEQSFFHEYVMDKGDDPDDRDPAWVCLFKPSQRIARPAERSTPQAIARRSGLPEEADETMDTGSLFPLYGALSARPLRFENRQLIYQSIHGKRIIKFNTKDPNRPVSKKRPLHPRWFVGIAVSRFVQPFAQEEERLHHP